MKIDLGARQEAMARLQEGAPGRNIDHRRIAAGAHTCRDDAVVVCLSNPGAASDAAREQVRS
jgi:hypothetical protein